MNTIAAPTSPEQIFGECGSLITVGNQVRVGYWSRYGFHTRGISMSRADALAKAADARYPDDPTPADQSWVPGSFTSPFTPYRKAVK